MGISRTARSTAFLFFLLGGLQSCAQNSNRSWIQLYNGEDLTNWIPKFTGYEVGVNHLDTFRVQDGLFTVSYDNWNDFDGEFGHMFYDQSFSHYLLRVEYRFIDDQVTNGPGWAYRNNGIMIHGQDPRSMTIDQEFPASIEVQLLGGNGSDPRATANVCTPGTNYVHNGDFITQHCVDSSSSTYHGDQWVNLEVEVRGDDLIRHTVNGELVFEYTETQLDERDPDATRLLSNGSPLKVDRGFISVQAESHPTQFRKIELLPLAN
jgi:hypothetical protein